MLSAVVDGGIIISKVLRDKSVLPKQVMLYGSPATFVRPRD